MDIASLSAPTTTLEVINPATGELIGIQIDLYAPTAEEVKAVANKARSKAMRTRNPISPDQQDRLGTDILVASIASWTWAKGLTFKGEAPDNSDDFKRLVVTAPEGHFIVKQINEAYQDEAAFMKR
ncbi:MAG: hypothetical protein KI785_05425 [Devosiaceae bacterium]|nr:hypothetical protein [Devosiaceae bacterium MH13]